MLSYSLNRIIILDIIHWENIVNAGDKSICVKVKDPAEGVRCIDRGLAQDDSCYLIINVVKKIDMMDQFTYLFCDQGNQLKEGMSLICMLTL